MEKDVNKVKQFIIDHKKQLIAAGTFLIGYRIGYKIAIKTYKAAIHNTFRYMDRYGYNVYKIIEGAKNV